MSITVTDLSKDLVGHGSSASPHLASAPLTIKFFKIQMDSSYPEGGESLDFTNYGFKTVKAVVLAGTGSDSTTATGVGAAYGTNYDLSATKLQIYAAGDSASAAFNEVQAATDLHKVFVYLVVFGYVR